MVREPYNIIFDYDEGSDGNTCGKVQNEYLYKNECGPVSCSEAGRHLAILGSIALSKNYETKNYYLATHADIKRVNDRTEHIEFLNVRAKVISNGKRYGEIFGEILDDNNQIIYQATIKYQILSQLIFSKLFHSFSYKKEIKNEISPYQKRRNLSDIVITHTEITGTYGTISPNECEGHFNDYPALPVAVIGNLFGELSIELFLFNNPRFSKGIVVSANINAKRLVFHDEYLTFRGKVKSITSSTSMLIYCEAVVNDHAIADIEVEVVGKNTDNMQKNTLKRSLANTSLAPQS